MWPVKMMRPSSELVPLEFSPCFEDHNYDQVTSVQYIFTVGEKRLLAPLRWHHGPVSALNSTFLKNPSELLTLLRGGRFRRVINENRVVDIESFADGVFRGLRRILKQSDHQID